MQQVTGRQVPRQVALGVGGLHSARAEIAGPEGHPESGFGRPRQPSPAEPCQGCRLRPPRSVRRELIDGPCMCRSTDMYDSGTTRVVSCTRLPVAPKRIVYGLPRGVTRRCGSVRSTHAMTQSPPVRPPTANPWLVSARNGDRGDSPAGWPLESSCRATSEFPEIQAPPPARRLACEPSAYFTRLNQPVRRREHMDR
jgi:hypothetical protein